MENPHRNDKMNNPKARRAGIEEAVALVCEKFRGLVDSDGQPYLLHLLRVMLTVDSPEAKTAAVLHDIVEDTDTDLDELRARGFSESVVDAVACLTHRSDQSYAEYVIGISRNSLAIKCKLADLSDNYRLDRVKYRDGMELADSRRLQRYILSYRFLDRQMDEAEYLSRMKEVE